MRSKESFQALPDDIKASLRSHWGFHELREHQIDPVLNLADGKHTFALLPTGGGKSLCFQLPAIMRGGLCLVITPLVALMEDQCAQLMAMGIKAEAWVGQNGDRVLDNLRFGGTQFLYMAPERITHPMFLARHQHWDVRTIVIDEVHCISQWGHDFRPAFRKIPHLQGCFPNAVWGGYTATATPEVIQDVLSNMPSGTKVFQSPVRRDNLHFAVCGWGDRDESILHDVQKRQDQGLVYVQSRHEAESWSQRMQQLGLKAASFHAGLPPNVKEQRQRHWMNGRLQVLACTSAFGMGIDAPNVRWVYHAGPSPNLESYIQEAGRAGRDGQQSDCVLYASKEDILQWKQRLTHQYPPLREVRKTYQHAANISSAAYGEQPENAILLQERSHLPALRLLAANGYFKLTDVSHVRPRGSIRWHGSTTPIRDEVLNAVAQWAARHCAHQLVEVEVREVQQSIRRLRPELGLNEAQCQQKLQELDAMGHLDWHPKPELPAFKWLHPRMKNEHVAVSYQLRDQALNQLELVEAYIELDQTQCRASFLEQLFFPDEQPPCGHCDLCKGSSSELEQSLRMQLDQGACDVKQLIFSFAPGLRTWAAQRLRTWYDQGQISANSHCVQWSNPNQQP